MQDEFDSYIDIFDRGNIESNYKDNVTTYIGGYIQRKIQKKISCVYCETFLNTTHDFRGLKLIERKSFGGLVRPSKLVSNTVNISEKILSQLMKERNIMSEKNVMHTMQTATLTVFREKQIDIEQILHPDNPSLNISHSVQMMKNVVRLYVSLRLKHFCKTFRQTRLDKNIRRSLAKSILFQNQ